MDGEKATGVCKFWLARRNARGSRRDYREVDKTLKISGIYKKAFSLNIKLGDLSLGVRHAVPRPQGSGGGFKRFAHSAGPVHDAWIL